MSLRARRRFGQRDSNARQQRCCCRSTSWLSSSSWSLLLLAGRRCQCQWPLSWRPCSRSCRPTLGGCQATGLAVALADWPASRRTGRSAARSQPVAVALAAAGQSDERVSSSRKAHSATTRRPRVELAFGRPARLRSAGKRAARVPRAEPDTANAKPKTKIECKTIQVRPRLA